MIIKKIFDGDFDESVHSEFLKFGKGEFRSKYLINAKKQKDKLILKTGPEFANYLVQKGLEKIKGKVSISGVIVSTLNLEISISKAIKQFMGIKQYQISGEIEASEILNLMKKYPRAFFALSFVLPDYELKIKPKAPKSAKPSTKTEQEPKAEFCSLKTGDKNFEREFLFDVKKEFKVLTISHSLNINSIIYPKDLDKLSPEQIRENSKRKGTIERIVNLDGKEERSQANFEA